MTSEMTLQAMLETLIEQQLVKPIRIGPIRTAVKQYASILGYGDPAQCAPDVFMKPDKVRNRAIEEGAPKHLGRDALRNLKNNVAYILRRATEVGLVSWPSFEVLNAYHQNGRFRPLRNEHSCPPKYILEIIPQSLQDEIATYELWSTRISN